MSPADLSIKRPVFITAIVIILLALGYLSLRRMPVDLFPNITFPIVSVSTLYPGAGPEEVETLVSKVLEEEMSTITGIKTLRSTNSEGSSMVIAEFTLETDIKYAEQQIRDRVSSAKRKLPDDIEEPVVRRIDPADQPIVILALTADLPPAELFDLADKSIKSKIEQVNQVGLVEVIGGREREIHVELDRKKLKSYEISATSVVNRIAAAGQNIPAGKVDESKTETVFRTLGEFKTIKDISSVIVSFLGNDVPVTVGDVGRVSDTVQDEKSRAYVNGERSVFMMVFRQSGANTIAVADAVRARVDKLNSELKNAKVTLVRDGSKMIRANVADVYEAIIIGIILTIIVVYFFLGSGRSTFITGLALPTSLIGAFFLMSVAGFTINVMSLLALSLAVGLLIDDAIVVRENIFRHTEMGKDPIRAASEGTKEVLLAVIATTLAVIAVFAPIGFLSGVVGQFFKEFGLTVCFAMAISLFDAVTNAPMLSAYFAGTSHGPKDSPGLWGRTVGRLVGQFDRFQTWLENRYENVLHWTLAHPLIVIGSSVLIFVFSLWTIKFIPKTFLPAQDMGEFSVSLDMPPGTSIGAMAEVATEVDKTMRANAEVAESVMIVGGRTGEANKAQFFVNMVPASQRKINTSDFKDKIREQLKPFAKARPIVKDIDMVMGGQRPFNLNIIGTDLAAIEDVSNQMFERLKKHPALKDVDISYRPGKPEFQVVPDKLRAERLGVATLTMGQELRTQVEGTKAAVFREKGEEYDIRVRLQEDQRNLKAAFESTFVPNVNQSLVRLSSVANPNETTGPANITRQDRGRYIQIAADIAPKGPGMGAVMTDIEKIFSEEIKLQPGMRYAFVGQAENFQELVSSMIAAALLGVLFIYLVLASLYESFVTPFTIMLVLPLAACGAFFGLLIGQESLNIFSMIGCIMLLGVATKNSILLVDYTNQLVGEGMGHAKAVVAAGKVRLRPILMTTFALIAGMLPIAIGLNEASKQRTGMGVAVIGGLISSTLLTLLVVPAAYSYFERFRIWSLSLVLRIVGTKPKDHSSSNGSNGKGHQETLNIQG
ncbi:MAG: efflux RND transporter permease subunit [Bdellovibrionales bacterium]